MSAQPKFDEMIELFQKGNDFELTAKQNGGGISKR